MKYNKTAQCGFRILCLAIASILVAPIVSVEASANHAVSARHVNSVQTKQAKSIEAGVHMGRLTPREARKLRQEQFEITMLEREMREDGKLSAPELRGLFKRLRSAQNNINKLLRNSISTSASDHPVN